MSGKDIGPVLKLRKSLLGLFPYVAALYAIASVGTVSRLLHEATAAHGFSVSHNLSPARQGLSVALFALSRVILAIPPVIAFLYAMAWWKLRTGKPSGRGWAIVASVAMLAQTIPLDAGTYLMIRHGRGAGRGLGIFVAIDVALLALSVAGVAAFGPRPAAGAQTVPARLPRISGDGTSGILDVVFWVISIAGYWFGWAWLVRWGMAHGLSPAHGYGVWVELLGAMLICTALHEAGHASVAIALDMRLRAFIVGPFQFRIRQGRWRFKFVPSQILSGGGATGAVPSSPNQPLWHDIVMIAAGPLASLLTGAVALTAAVTAQGQFYERYWEFVGLMGIFGAISFVVNLIPMRPEAQYSDGARIYQLLSGGPWADFNRAASIAGATLVTALRPRDYDMQAIERASRSFTQGGQAVWLRLLASSHYLDCGDMARARQATMDAEAIFQASRPELTGGLFAVLTFDTAFLCRDAAATRQWAERMDAKKSELNEFPMDYWLAQAALHWIGNQPGEAQASLAQASALADKAPAAGAYDYDRHRCALLREAMDAQISDEPLAVSVAG